MSRCGFFPAVGVASGRGQRDRHRPVGHQSPGFAACRFINYWADSCGTGSCVIPTCRGETTADSRGEDANRKVAEGWRFVRFDIPTQGPDCFDPRTALRECVAQVAAVREAVGEEIEIIIDVHTRLDPVDAVDALPSFGTIAAVFCGRSRFARKAPPPCAGCGNRLAVPIAVGEQYHSKWAFQDVIENDWTDFARMDLCIAGGITEALKIAGWCEAHSIAVAPHNPLGPVSTAACLHLDLALSNFAVQECARVPGQVLAGFVSRAGAI